MQDLPYLMGRLYGTPLLVSKAKLDVILATLLPRLVGRDSEEPAKKAAAASQATPYRTATGLGITEAGIAIIPVVGSLVRRGAWLDAESGLVSYATIQSDVEAAVADPEVKAVLLDLDTPGGEAGGVFDLADAIRNMATQGGKPIWSIANEAALSAGYAIASATNRIWVSRTGEVGSIGVVAAHLDVSDADKKAGMSYTYVFAGAHKVDGHPHAPLSPVALADIQADVDGLYGMFVSTVARNRGMSGAAIRATEARIYRGADAVKAGLADAVGTTTDALAALADEVERPRTTQLKAGRSAVVQSTAVGAAPPKATDAPGQVPAHSPATDGWARAANAGGNDGWADAFAKARVP